MNSLNKIPALIPLVLGIGAALLFSRLHSQDNRLNDLAHQLAINEAKLGQLRSEHARTLSALTTTQKDLLALENRNKYSTTHGELETWLTRVSRLKQWLQVNPQKRIPEMQFLNSNDWLSVTLDNPLDTDAQIRDALNKLRAMAKRKPQFVDNITKALQAYLKANNGLPPTDPLQLRDYLTPSLSDEILLRYEPVPEVEGKNDANGIKREGMALGGSGRAILQEKASVDDDYDTWILFTEKGGWATGDISAIGKIVTQATVAFTKANSGRNASSPQELLPYLSTPIEPRRLQEYWDVTRR